MKGSCRPRPISTSTFAGCFIKISMIWIAVFLRSSLSLLRAFNRPWAWSLFLMVSFAGSVRAVISSHFLAYPVSLALPFVRTSPRARFTSIFFLAQGRPSGMDKDAAILRFKLASLCLMLM